MSTYKTRFKGREEIADRTMAFHFEMPDQFNFKAGEAIDLILPVHTTNGEQPARHTFSIVSAPHEARLTVATRMRNSPYKQAMGSLTVGTGVELDGPFGELGFHDDRQRSAILIAGGIGITPFVSILRQAAMLGSAQSFVLIYSNRRPEDAAFLPELQALEKQMANFQLLATMTQIAPAKTAWSGMTGRIAAGMLTSVAAKQAAPLYYLAGPPEFVEATRDLLQGIGIADNDIRSEGFYGY